MNAVKASLDPADVIHRLRTLAATEKFRVESYGVTHGFDLVALSKRTPGPRPRIYISATSHGDEPAGPGAILRLLEEHFFDARANWFLCPMLNPAGLARRTRENAEGIDLNRDYRGTPKSFEVAAHIRWLQRQPRFDVTLCLHEDWETTGFYIYELNPHARPPLAESITAAVAKTCPIEPLETIDGRSAKLGIIRPDADPAARELWPESIYLRQNHCTLGCTTETPSALPLDQRIAAQCVAVQTAVGLVVDEFQSKLA